MKKYFISYTLEICVSVKEEKKYFDTNAGMIKHGHECTKEEERKATNAFMMKKSHTCTGEAELHIQGDVVTSPPAPVRNRVHSVFVYPRCFLKYRAAEQFPYR
jgi:hypothetical protein